MTGVPRMSPDELETRVVEYLYSYALGIDPELLRDQSPLNTGSKAIATILAENPPPPIPPRELIMIGIGVKGVEDHLVDYTPQIMSLNYARPGMESYVGIWTGQEAWHSIILGACLKAMGALTMEGIMLGHRDTLTRKWDPVNHPKAPKDGNGLSRFLNALYGICYVVIQELKTALTYKYFGKAARRARPTQRALELLCRRLTSEEAQHHAFYLGLCEIFLAYDRDLFVATFEQAYADFQMPGAYIIERNRDDEAPIIAATTKEYVEWTRIAGNEGIVPIPPRVQKIVHWQATSQNDYDPGVEATRQIARRDCWDENQRKMRDLFNHLAIPLPPDLIAA